MVPRVFIHREDTTIAPRIIIDFGHAFDDCEPDKLWVSAINVGNLTAERVTARFDGKIDPIAVVIFFGLPDTARITGDGSCRRRSSLSNLAKRSTEREQFVTGS